MWSGRPRGGLVLASDGSLDFERSFERVNYPPCWPNSRCAITCRRPWDHILWTFSP